MSIVTINGEKFDTGVDWAVDKAQIRMTAVETGPVAPITDALAFDPSGPNAGVNSDGVTVNSWSDTLIDVILDDTFDGLWVFQVFLFDVTGIHATNLTVTPRQYTGDPIDPLDYPVLEGVYSPAPNQVAFVGQRFVSAVAGEATHGSVRLESYGSAGNCFNGGKLNFYLDGTPQLNGWILVAATDTLIILENDKFTDCSPDDASANFTVTGVSLDAPNYGEPVGDGYYFWEPWAGTFNTEIDGTTPLP